MNSKLVILDANVIIELFKKDLFASVINRYHLHIPETIKAECIYYYDALGNKVDINLDQYSENPKMTIVSANADQYIKLACKLKEDFYRSIDDGEKEALALIHSAEDDEMMFCSGDLPAIKALGVIGRSSQAISLESLLSNIGIRNTNLKGNYTQKVLEKEAGKAYQEKELYLK